MFVTRIVRALVVPIAVAGLALAQTPNGGFHGTLRAIDGRRVEGRLEVAADGTAKIGDVSLLLADVLGFERTGAVEQPAPARHRVWLRSGQDLPVMSLRGKPGSDGRPTLLSLTLPCGLEIDVPFTAVRALRHGGSERPEPALFAADLKNPPANDDLIYVQKDGKPQRSAVTVTGLQPDKIDFLLRGDAFDFPFVGVTAIVFGTNTGFAPDRQPKPRTTIEMVTGERIEGRVLEIGALLRLRLDEGPELDVAPEQFARLRVVSDRLVWLSDLTPKVEQTPAFDRTWPWNNDRSPAGPGLILRKRTFVRGIGMVPRTRLTYDVGGAYDVFEAVIGIDDRGGPQANAIFRVLVDGKVAFESQPKTLGAPPEEVRVELNKCKLLAIEADFGKNYDLGDFCVFADARVLQR